MTIRLLAQYQGNPPNTIVTLAGGVETALVAAGNATTNLAGGVPPAYLTPANTQIGDILYGPDGVPLGLADRSGKLLMNFNGITAPGAPTGLTLTPIAGGVLAAFTPSATLGGTVGTGFEVTLSNGIVQRGAGSPIAINSPAGAVTATVKQMNGAGLSAASAASASATVTAYTTPSPPTAPTIGTLVAGNGKVTVNWTAPAINGSALSGYLVTLSNGASAVAGPSATSIDVTTPNGVAVTARVRAMNGEGQGPRSAESNSVTPSSAAAAILNSTTVFGASHMAYGNPAVATEGSARGGGETSVSYIGIVNDELRKTGPGYDLIHLRAVGGTTVYEHEGNQLPSVLTDPTECVWYNSSPNAYNDTLTAGRAGAPYTQASILAAEKRIMAQVAAAKKDVNWVSLMPVWSTGSSGSVPRSGEFAAHVAEMELEAAKYPNVTYHNVYDLLRDPASGVNDPLPNYVQTVDGIHLTSWGARFIGEFIAPRVSAKAASLVKYRAQGPNLCPPFNTTGGTSTANGGTINGAALIPAGWDVTIAANGVTTVTVSKPSADVLRLAITNTAVSTPTVVNLSATNTAAMLAAFVQGDTIQNGFDFATVGTPVGLTRIAQSFRINGATTGTSWRTMARNTTFEPDAVFKYSQAPASGRRWSHPWVIDLAVTQVDLITQFAVTQQGSLTIDISLPVLNKLVVA